MDELSIWSVVGGDLVDDNHRLSMEYDAMGRATEMTDVLGTFGYDYDQPSKGLSRLAKVTYPNGQESIYAYLPAAQHHRLEKITHRTSASAMISEYGYGYGPGGQLQTWTQKVGSAVQQDWTVEHDDADQLRSVVVREGSSVVRQQFYNYDQSGNRVSYQDGQSVMKFGHNEINQINSRPSGGLVRFEGLMDEPGTASVNGQPAKMRTVLDALGEPEFRFSQDVELGEGTNAVTVVGRDGSGNETTKNYEVEVAGVEGQGVPSYDGRGNMLNNGRGQSYEWDSLNRLLSITYADESQTEFTYDALSRRVKEVEKDTEGEVVSEKRLLWEGTEIVQERNAEGEVVKRYAGAGVALVDDSKYYFTRDHLGSVRQVSDEEEAVVETYTYDAYGVQTASAAGGPGGVRLSDFRYTGHWYHEKSELHLALYRAYDAELGVWISEDPIGEKGGLNLYGYVGNSPISWFDPLGLDPYGGYANGRGNSSSDINSFEDRAQQGAKTSCTFGFASPTQLIDALKNAKSPITRLDLHGHGIPEAFMTGEPTARIYEPDFDNLAAAIADGSINMPKNSSIRLFACNQGANAQKLAKKLGDLGRGDIKVTGAWSPVSPNTSETRAKGTFRTYQGGMQTGSSNSIPYR